MEKRIIEFWKEEDIFKRTISSRPKDKEFSFYDGPPFATGLPHYGHILTTTMKDMVPRYKTMKGYRVPRRWGWDCHGLPVEYEKEKELGISSKKGIEEYGIANFNEACRSTVLRYASEWKKIVERVGRFVDVENDYKTMEPWYMESIWWVFKELWKKDLVYQGEKVVPYCLRCATSLSNFEAAQGYVSKQDTTLTVKFKALSLKYTDETPLYFLAWTTTPWTLPSNLALAVGPDIRYALIKDLSSNELYILAEEAVERYYKEEEFELLHTYMGSDFEGVAYEPMFPYFEEKGSEGAFNVYTADFVTTSDGTGIVHQAPFGEDDFRLLSSKGVKPMKVIAEDGTFVPAVVDFAGKQIFDANKEIITFLKERGVIRRQDTMEHNYPHCWRCDSPLIYNPISTWFVEVTKIKQDLLDNNKKIHWVPENMKMGRFGKWLENVRDWGVSRNRYWGTPLPVWKCTTCTDMKVLGSVQDLYKARPDRITKITLMRHGEGEHTLQNIWSSDRTLHHLTDEGKRVVRENVKKNMLEADVVIASPLVRTLETAELVHEELQGRPEMKTDDRLCEMAFGVWEGVNTTSDAVRAGMKEWRKRKLDGTFWSTPRCEGAESFADVEKRLKPFLEEVLQEYAGKSVILVSHGAVLRALEKMLYVMPEHRENSLNGFKLAESRVVYVDRNTGKQLDLHKHIIDDMTMSCECGGEMNRISEVFDCWFESGSMPYAQNHFPFENVERTKRNFPADFIAEGVDQTRGWFYTLHVLSTALSDGKSGLGMYQPAFKNIIVNGIILAEDGKKMSKRLKNYPDPNYVFDTYGADAMRFYIINSPVVAAEDLRFSEKGVEEVVKKVLLPLWNAYSFFVTYANLDGWSPFTKPTVDKGIDPKQITNKLDQWILSELQELLRSFYTSMEAYDLRKSTDVITDFLDKLTNWYIRRSRRRFWKSENDGDKRSAYTTLHEVLVRTCQVLAPVCPFITEEIYKGLMPNETSIHLSYYPDVDEELVNKDLEKEIDLTRLVVKLGHSIRSHEKIKVRQPLSLVRIALPDGIDSGLLSEQMPVILEELNVKNVEFVTDPKELGTPLASPNAKILGPLYGKAVQDIIREAKTGNFTKLPNGNIQVLNYELKPHEVEIGYVSKEGISAESEGGMVVALETTLTDDLVKEGLARDMIRIIQDIRKDLEFDVENRILITIHFMHEPLLKDALMEYKEYIMKETLADEIILGDGKVQDKETSKEVELENSTMTIELRKI